MNQLTDTFLSMLGWWGGVVPSYPSTILLPALLLAYIQVTIGGGFRSGKGDRVHCLWLSPRTIPSHSWTGVWTTSYPNPPTNLQYTSVTLATPVEHSVQLHMEAPETSSAGSIVGDCSNVWMVARQLMAANHNIWCHMSPSGLRHEFIVMY